MCGLVSKWADDKELVDQAQKQDGSSTLPQSNNNDHLKSKWHSSITIDKSQPLASKWAAADESPQERVKETHNDQKHRNSHKMDHKMDRKLNSFPKKPSHANTHNHQERNRKPREAHEEREGVRSDRGHRKTKSGNFEKNSRKIALHDNDNDNSEEELPPITDAGKSFAARLGIASNTNHSVNAKGDHHSHDEERGHNGSKDNDEELAPMTDAGMSLAQRLGMVTVQDNSKSHNLSRSKSSDKTRKHASSKPVALSGRGSYQTPHQKKMEAVKKVQHEEDLRKKEEERIKEAKLKSEVESMFAKLGDNTRSWADIEDED